MARLQIEGLCKGWDFPVIDRLDLTVEEGEFFVIVGPSSIGKTTLLRLIAGLESPDRRPHHRGRRDISPLPPYRRRVAMTFESYALYPHLTVGQNIASPLKARRARFRGDRRWRVRTVAKLLQHRSASRPSARRSFGWAEAAHGARPHAGRRPGRIPVRRADQPPRRRRSATSCGCSSTRWRTCARSRPSTSPTTMPRHCRSATG